MLTREFLKCCLRLNFWLPAVIDIGKSIFRSFEHE
jgi:hypothetical protein